MTIDTADAKRTAAALRILEGSASWLKCRTQDGTKAYAVPGTKPNTYHLVNLQDCSCPDRRRRGVTCKHMPSVALHCAKVRAERPRRHTPAEVAAASRRYEELFPDNA